MAVKLNIVSMETEHFPLYCKTTHGVVRNTTLCHAHEEKKFCLAPMLR